MEFYRKLLVGQAAKKRRREIVWKLKHEKPLRNIYLLTLPANENNSLDILPANLLLQPYYKRRSLFVLGIAQGKEEALELLTKLVETIYAKTGSVKIADYIAGED